MKEMEVGKQSTWVLADPSSLVLSCFLAQELSLVSSVQINWTFSSLFFFFLLHFLTVMSKASGLLLMSSRSLSLSLSICTYTTTFMLDGSFPYPVFCFPGSFIGGCTCVLFGLFVCFFFL